MDVADVFSLAGKLDQAALTIEEARRLYEEKGCLVSAATARARLADLSEEAPRR
jgi:hypothetical protein